jgi:hypothetical protein
MPTGVTAGAAPVEREGEVPDPRGSRTRLGGDLGVGAERLRTAARGERGEDGIAVDAILGVANLADHLHRPRRDAPAVAAGFGRGSHLVATGSGIRSSIERPAIGRKSSRNTSRGDARGCPIRGAGDHHAAVAAADSTLGSPSRSNATTSPTCQASVVLRATLRERRAHPAKRSAPAHGARAPRIAA